MIDESFLKKNNFSDNQIEKITEDDYMIIRNFFNVQEINKTKFEHLIKATKLLAPIFRKIKIVDMYGYVGNLRKEVAIVEPDEVLDDYKEKPFSSINNDQSSKDNLIEQEFDRLLSGKYIIEQVWILEYLVNNPNLFMKGEQVEAIKNKLKEKELESEIHSIFLKNFLDLFRTTKKVNMLLNFKHFSAMKEIFESRKQILLRRSPISFRALVEVFEEFGFEEKQEFNEKMCLVLAEIIEDQKLEKILRFGAKNFGEIKLVNQKKKVINKLFKS